MVRTAQFVIGLIILIGLEVSRVYFIMPFPGSQQDETIELAYFLHQNIFWLRLVGLLIIVFPAIQFYSFGTTLSRWLVSIALVLYVGVFYLFNFRFQADKMFYQPEHTIFADAANNVIKPEQLVLGVSVGDRAKAYPIELIGYHHQVRDSLGGKPLMITYCTVCRTGRTYSPLVDGKPEEFRLVGMDHFNAMFEDASTGSWWRQVSGEAITGPLKGKALEEIPSQQMSLKAWLERYPHSEILQPDSTFAEKFEGMKGYDEGKGGSLTARDSLSWKEKSWVIGVQLQGQSRAYDWNDVISHRVINDTLGGIPIVVALGNDSVSFHVWQRDSLTFKLDSSTSGLTDTQTQSSWNWSGKCVEGPLIDKTLPPVQSYQEFWHSWKTFRPYTTRYSPQE